MSVNNNIINKMKNKILTMNDYTFTSDSGDALKLSDNVLLYNTGDIWKIIPLMLALSYPIIYDKYSMDNITYDITIVLCPVTLRATMFNGLFEFETYQDYRMVLREVLKEAKKNVDTNVLMPIDIGLKIDKKYMIQSNKRTEIKISTLRSIIGLAPDSLFMMSNKKIKPVIDLDYYSNFMGLDNKPLEGLIHPKTLIYVMHYKSHNTDEDKISLILGKDISQNNVTGYDARHSKIFDYLEKHQKKTINREGFVMPMLWYMAKDIYRTSKVVSIT